MHSAIAALFLAALAGVASAANWAVLICGSNGFDNYRHHSDICHAYHILIKSGVPASNIITFLYDDVANDPQNPFPGKIFNKPTAVDVYAGCVKDYTGDAVNVTTVTNVLRGNAAAVKGVGTGRVLNSKSGDRVFLNFVDHGAAGLIAMPVGDYWYAPDFQATLAFLNTNKMYSELVFYLEACEAGSMFDGLLPAGVKVYATTAANPDESSWGTYCPPEDMIDGTEIGSCLGDLYSVNWMENTDSSPKTETLLQQYNIVVNLTTQSHVMQYGDLSIDAEPIGNFEGPLPKLSLRAAPLPVPSSAFADNARASVSSSRDATLLAMYTRFTRATGAAKVALGERVVAEIQSQNKADATFRALMGSLAGASLETPSITAWDCYKGAIAAYEAACGRFTDYSLKYARVLANACEASPLPVVASAVNAACSA